MIRVRDSGRRWRRKAGEDWGVRGADGERGVEMDGEHWLGSGAPQDWGGGIGSGQGMGS